MKISTEKLKEIIESHGKWLRDEEGGQCANLQDANLQDTNLQCANLQCADLRGANLKDANLRGANLQDANLLDADLRGAYLQCANLQCADLRRANLQDADLRRAYLRGTYLQDADLRGTYLQDADLRGTYLPNGMYQIVGCGSYNRCTTYDSINDRVICGCWKDGDGNHLEAFKKRIEAIYGDKGETPNAACYTEYMAAINFFEMVKRVRKL